MNDFSSDVFSYLENLEIKSYSCLNECVLSGTISTWKKVKAVLSRTNKKYENFIGVNAGFIHFTT